MTAAYDPDVVAAAGPAGWTLRERRPAPPTTCTRPRPAAQHLRVHRLAEARPPTNLQSNAASIGQACIRGPTGP